MNMEARELLAAEYEAAGIVIDGLGYLTCGATEEELAALRAIEKALSTHSTRVRLDALEEAAKVADTMRVSPSYAAPTDWDYGAQDACVAIAKAIRNLGAPNVEGGET